MKDLEKEVEFAVELEDGCMIYLGEFDMTNWNRGWDAVYAKAEEISQDNECDPEFMEIRRVDHWLQNAVSIFNICNERNRQDDSKWFTFEVVMERDDALLVKEMLEKYKDSFFLQELLENYERWDKL